jgi:N6-adenosine-specific RNA methylase IME4
MQNNNINHVAQPLPQGSVIPSLRVDKYNVIYVDPPWKIKVGRPLKGYKMKNGKQLFIPTSNKSRDTEYPSMTIEQIKGLKVSEITADDAHLYVWVTNSHLPFAFEIIKHWGFEYSTTIVWAKTEWVADLVVLSKLLQNTCSLLKKVN